jgi:hypothetical protein
MRRGVLQERVLNQKNRPLPEMIFVTNLCGALILHCIAASSGELALLQQRLVTHPTAILWLLLTVVLAYGGSYAFTACIKGFGAVVATGVGICRKFVSVLLSFIIFPKPFNVQHVFSIALFFAGMVLSWSQQASISGKGSGGGKKVKQADRRKEQLAQLQKNDTAAAASDTSSTGADSDEGTDSPMARTLLVATPYGTPGTPTATRQPKPLAHLDARSAPKGPM